MGEEGFFYLLTLPFESNSVGKRVWMKFSKIKQTLLVVVTFFIP